MNSPHKVRTMRIWTVKQMSDIVFVLDLVKYVLWNIGVVHVGFQGHCKRQTKTHAEAAKAWWIACRHWIATLQVPGMSEKFDIMISYIETSRGRWTLNDRHTKWAQQTTDLNCGMWHDKSMDKLNYNVIFWASELVLVDAVVGRSGVETGRRLICRGGTSMYHFGWLHHIVPDQNKTNQTRPLISTRKRNTCDSHTTCLIRCAIVWGSYCGRDPPGRISEVATPGTSATTRILYS